MVELDNKIRILILLGLTGGFLFVELIVGYFTNSMSLVADSFHMLSDEIALLVAYVSLRISTKTWKKNTYGWARAEILGALINSVFLVALCFSIAVEAFQRFMVIKLISNPALLLIVGGLGLVINVIGLGLFYDYSGLKRIPKRMTSNLEETCLFKNSEHEGNDLVASSSDLVASSSDQLQPNNDSEYNAINKRLPETIPEIDSGENKDVIESDDENNNDVKSSLQIGVHNGRHRIDPKKLKMGMDDPSIFKARKISHGHSHGGPGQMNMRGVFLHVLSDALGSIIVIISALLYWLTDWKYKYYVDPALSLILVALILNSVWPLLRDSAFIVLEAVPTHLEMEDLQDRLLSNVDGILGVHEFHVWKLVGNRIIASAHVRLRYPSEYMETAVRIKQFFHNEGIHSTTIQPEFIGDIDSMTLTNDQCILICPRTPNHTCFWRTCCRQVYDANINQEVESGIT